jgi:bacterioferritin
LLETHRHDIGDILRESLGHEKATLKLYEKLLKVVQGDDIMLEEYAREHISLETRHIGEVDKMLRKPGDIASFERSKAS